MSGVGFASYEIPRSGIFVSERGLDVTGHNIANVNTPGYVRQQAMIKTSPYQGESLKTQMGLGASIQEIRQIRHAFLDNIYRQENTTLGYWETRNKTYEDVQAVLGEPLGSGLQSTMNSFWDSWQELSKEPDSLTVRALVRQRGEAVVQQINHVGSQMDKLQDDLNSEIKVRVDEVNSLTAGIANMNLEIQKAELSGDKANDFRDQRNVMLDKLSKLMGVDVTEMQDGQMNVTAGGYTLVTKGIQYKVYAGESTLGDKFVVPKLVDGNYTIPLKGGIIKGLLESRGEVTGTSGSLENGSPNTKVDVNIVVDTSSGNLPKIKSDIASYVQQLQQRGLDYNLNLITFDSTSALSSYGNDAAGFLSAVNALVQTPASVNDLGLAIGDMASAAYRTDANRTALVFTDESMGGDGNVITTGAADTWAATLKGVGIHMSVVSPASTHDTSVDATLEKGWSYLTGATGGKVFDLSSADQSSVVAAAAGQTNDEVDFAMSQVAASGNIVSDLRKRLNALVNAMVREVNYLHRQGKTLGNPPQQGDDFFQTVKSNLPLEMGNIKLNSNLSNLNNVAASISGASGDNTNALAMSGIRHLNMMKDAEGVMDFDSYYQSIILNVGNGAADAARISESQTKLVQSADDHRTSISGVSMDEEMTNMMKFKFAYDAASRALNVVDSMMEMVINRMGVVGR